MQNKPKSNHLNPIIYDNTASYLPYNGQESRPFGLYCKSIGCFTLDPGNKGGTSLQNLHYRSATEGRTLNEHHLVIIADGEGYLEKRNMPRRKIIKGDIFLLNPGEWHLYYPDKTTGWRQYWITFESDKPHSILSYLDPYHDMAYRHLGVNATIESILTNMIEVAGERLNESQTYLTSALIHILSIIHYKMSNTDIAPKTMEEKVRKACEIIRSDLKGQRSLNDIAAQLGISYSLFRRIFKTVTNISPRQYQLEEKMKVAEEMLASSHKKISTIAQDLGFSDVAQFCSFFKKRQGITARDYRMTHKATKSNNQ